MTFARVVLSLFYFTLFVPFGVGVRLFDDPLVLPTAFRVQDTAYGEMPQQVLGKHGREEGIEMLDLLPVFREACQEAPPGESCGPEDRYLWADMWMHPGALSHRLIAECILNLLEEK